MKHGLLGIFTVIVLTACSGDDGPKPAPTPAPGAPIASPTPAPVSMEEWRKVHSTVTSSITGVTYPVHVYLPQTYLVSAQDYPVIYATDGQWVFESFSRMLAEQEVPAILVAIEQGPDNRRATDYALPGAEDYLAFLRAELLPLIESEYRVDTLNRSLVGSSFGGLFVGTVLFLDDVSEPLFKNYMAFDASFWQNWPTTQELEQARYNASQELNVTLVLSAATGAQSNRYNVGLYQQMLEQRNYSGLTIYRRDYPVNHEQIADPSFEDAIQLLFPEQ